MTDNSYKLEDILDSYVLCLRILVMKFVEKIDLSFYLLTISSKTWKSAKIYSEIKYVCVYIYMCVCVCVYIYILNENMTILKV